MTVCSIASEKKFNSIFSHEFRELHELFLVFISHHWRN